ncbi:hypothetical protein Leryth_019159 [Lithospermum erythrorhizon]|nr:hypothetical protein Leryth_019159 [Lithospermum erythrorhizon]
MINSSGSNGVILSSSANNNSQSPGLKTYFNPQKGNISFTMRRLIQLLFFIMLMAKLLLLHRQRRKIKTTAKKDSEDDKLLRIYMIVICTRSNMTYIQKPYISNKFNGIGLNAANTTATLHMRNPVIPDMSS